MKKKDSKLTKRRLRTSYISTIISISLVLFLLGLVGLLVLNAKQVSDYVKENIGFSIIIKEDVKEVDIIKLKKVLDTKNYVKSADHVSKEEAAKELQKELGEDFIEFLGYNPLLASIDVHLHAKYANPDSIEHIKNEINKNPQVKEIYYQKSLVHLINDNVKRIGLIIILFSVLLFLIALTLINNTIRLSVYSKRFIINTMHLVGATRSFIRRPFLLKSVLNGSIAAFIATGLLISTIYFIEKEFSGIINFQNIEIIGILFISVFLLGIIISWLSTYFAVNKYLNINIDKLYY
jgi:cell division transport system permease protein